MVSFWLSIIKNLNVYLIENHYQQKLIFFFNFTNQFSINKIYGILLVIGEFEHLFDRKSL